MAGLARRALGRDDLTLTALSFGGAAIGGLYEPVPDAQAEATVHRALELGLRYLDTAPLYGHGLSERRMGAVLAGWPRDAYVISTKVGRLLQPPAGGGAQPAATVWDWSRTGIRRSLESSLDRLGIDHVDVVYLHDPDRHEDLVYASAYPALAELRDEGVVRAIGAGMNQTPLLARLVRRLDLDVVLCAGRYTLLDQQAIGELLPLCLQRRTAVVIGGAYNSGLLADPRPGARYAYAPASPELVARARRLQRACADLGVPLRAAALRFPLTHPAVASVLVGCRSPAEVEDNLAMFTAEVPAALWQALVDQGLLDERVTAP